MKHILCYGDSNTWGASPDQLTRYDFKTRWPGVLQQQLGNCAHIYENGLCGRTTGYTDDVELGRNGREGFRYVLEMHAPLDLVILMLGSNDCKCRFHSHPAWDSALNMQQLVCECGNTAYGVGGVCVPQVLVIAPACLKDNWQESWVRGEFDAASTNKSRELAALYEQIAAQNGAEFLNASQYAVPGTDCVHLTAASHAALARAVAEKAAKMLWPQGV